MKKSVGQFNSSDEIPHESKGPISDHGQQRENNVQASDTDEHTREISRAGTRKQRPTSGTAKCSRGGNARPARKHKHVNPAKVNKTLGNKKVSVEPKPFFSTQTKKFLPKTVGFVLGRWIFCLGFMMLGGVQPRSQPCKLVGCFFWCKRTGSFPCKLRSKPDEQTPPYFKVIAI